MPDLPHNLLDLLDELRELPVDEQRRRLAGLPPAISEQLEPCLNVATVKTDRIDGIAGPEPDSQRTVLDDSARLLHGPAGIDMVPGYDIVGDRPLGEGGMGVVWKAIQISTKRPVALKVMSAASFGSEHARRRFEREVELTAKLDHPHIARIYDSGLHAGICFYAMELVDGQTLDAHCENQKLSPLGIVELMIVICRAVQYAHQKGIIHRDLKPSNILVDKEGQPRVLDFGLAKALEGGSELSTDGVAAGTPIYMSPEQASGRVDAIDTRSDVYTLAVILFYLLSGKFPHDISENALDVMRRIREEEPRRLRAIDPRTHRELEAVLSKAMAREPERRYGSAGELGDDLDRYLQGEPLNARPPTVSYLFKKKLKKFRLPIGIGTGICAVLIAMAIWSYVRVKQERTEALRLKGVAEANAIRATNGEAEAQRQKHVAEEQQAAAVKSASIASQQRAVALGTIHDLIFDLRGKLDAPGLLAVRKSVFELALTRLEQVQKRAGDSQTDREGAVARQQIGDILQLLGKTREARDAFIAAIEIAERVAQADPDNPYIPGDLQIFHGRLASVKYELGDYPGAIESFEKCLAIAENVVAAHSQDSVLLGQALGQVANSSGNLAKIYLDRGDASRAAPYCNKSFKAAEALESVDPADRRSLPLAMSRMAQLCRLQGDLPGARSYLQQAIAAAAKGGGAETYLLIDGLGAAARDLGDQAAAKKCYETAREILERKMQSDPQDQATQRDLDRIHENLAELSLSAGDRATAQDEFSKALKISQARVALEPDNSQTRWEMAIDYLGLGKSCMDTDAARAEDCFRKGLAILQESPQASARVDNRKYIPLPTSRLSIICSGRGDFAGAVDFERQCNASLEESAKADPSNLKVRMEWVGSYIRLGEAHTQLGALPSATAAFNKAVSLCESTTDRDPTDQQFKKQMANTCVRLGDLSLGAGDFLAAKGFFARDIAIIEAVAKSDAHPEKLQSRIAGSHLRVGENACELKDFQAAADAYNKSLLVCRTALERDPGNVDVEHTLAMTYRDLAALSNARNDPGTAKMYFLKALPLVESWAKAAPDDNAVQTDVRDTYSCLGNITYQAGDLAAAKQWYLKLLPLAEARYKAVPSDGTSRFQVWFLYRRLGSIFRKEGELPIAASYFEKFLAMSQEWARDESNNPMRFFAVAEAYLHLGRVKELAQDYRSALDLYEQGLQVTRTLDAKWNYTNAGYLQLREDLKKHADSCRASIAATRPAETRPAE